MTVSRPGRPEVLLNNIRNIVGIACLVRAVAVPAAVVRTVAISAHLKIKSAHPKIKGAHPNLFI